MPDSLFKEQCLCFTGEVLGDNSGGNFRGVLDLRTDGYHFPSDGFNHCIPAPVNVLINWLDALDHREISLWCPASTWIFSDY